MKTRIISCFILMSFLFNPHAGVAQDTSTQMPDIFSLLQQHEDLDIMLEASLKKLKKTRKEEKWQPAKFRIMAGDSVAYEQAVQVASRGKMRKKTCDIPPIKVRFFEEKPENDSLADINELKLVVNCRNTMKDEQLVLRENFAYALYNLLTDESFRIKTAKVRVKEAGRKRNSLETTAFFIESQQELASRLNGRALKVRIISPRRMDSLAYARMSLFQYMIGNTDWGAYTRHNMKVIVVNKSKLVPIPYDFDYAGLVDADYARVAPSLPMTSVRERYFLGLCQSPDLYQQVINEFLAKKAEMLALCDSYPGFTYESRKEVKLYLGNFFETIENPRKVKKEILDHCDLRIKKKK